MTIGLMSVDAKSQEYNVLFISVDDLRPDLGCYSNSIIKSPNIDKLAENGTLFTMAYCQQAVCAPSRASLLSGLRPNSTNVTDLRSPLQEVAPNTLTLPKIFKNNGYEVISLGKVYHHRGKNGDDPNSWSEPEWNEKGDWKGRGYLAKESQEQIDFEKLKGKGPAFEAPDVSDDAYPDGQLAKEAIRRLKGFKESGKPFFLACGFHKPHLPFNAPKKYWDLYNPEGLYQSTQHNWPVDMPAYAGTTFGELRSYTNIPNKSKELHDTLAQQLIHGYYASVSYVDAQIGKVIDELDRLGLTENTVIVLWGDHGWKLNDYGSWCKHTNFEIDTHVPLLLSAPGYKKGKRSKALVEFVDIYPTLAELCDIEVPNHCEGTSMVPLLKKPNRKWKEAAFSQYPRKGLMGHSIRSGIWRYTEWIGKEGNVIDRELYDHSGGPLADRNLANEEMYKSVVEELSEILDKGDGWKKIRIKK